MRTKTVGGVFRGDRLRYVRLDAEMTLERLSRRVGISKANLNRIELNQQEPSLRTARKIADAFGVDLDWLTENDDPDCPTCGHKTRLHAHLSGCSNCECGRPTK